MHQLNTTLDKVVLVNPAAVLATHTGCYDSYCTKNGLGY